ncbi:YeeE/YedE family protein [Ruegeria sp. 2205SS24-7]|uniref:YeeE/YedE family protein n=1 Tax=Ruegeria discodermiae TaxID=3064389 RepID=UPI00274061BA|nr:YeeE/YedE family protein [Ruegeria sp. 2205SS24-7]MDP5218952.1 YeeE/YedE family protein [Ruegeria sp. 2205SS24-7]
MFEFLGDANTVALIGLVGGMVLGLAARIGRFCTLGAIEDYVYANDDRRLRMWVVAIGVAMIGSHTGIALGWLDPLGSPYIAQTWSPIGSIVGGLMFGYGMAISGNCGYGALARLGGGDLRAFVIVLMLGLSAYVAMSGPLAYLRVWVFPVEMDLSEPQSVSFLAERLTSIPAWLIGIVIGTALVLIALANKRFRNAPSQILWGAAVGLAIVSGWLGTNWVATHGFEGETVQTHTFAAPLGDTIFYLMTASGTTLSFAVGSVAGVLIGAFLGSWSKGHFRWEACEDPRELKRQMLGAAIMGPGAIIAVGCSVGQGISAFSLLAYSAPVVFVSIFAGAALGLRQLVSGLSFAIGR